MNCPNCGHVLEETYAKVKQPMPFSGPERLAKKGKLTVKRKVHTCPRCGKAWILTFTLKETEILDK